MSINCYAQTNVKELDTVQLTLADLSTISSFNEIYPYEIYDEHFVYFEFKQFEVLYYGCGYGFFSQKYSGSLPNTFFELLDKPPANKECKTGSTLKFVNILIQNGKNYMRGDPFIVHIVDAVIDNTYFEDDEYGDDDYDDEEEIDWDAWDDDADNPDD